MVSNNNKLYRTGTSLVHRRMQQTNPKLFAVHFHLSRSFCFPAHSLLNCLLKQKASKTCTGHIEIIVTSTETEPERITIKVQLRTGTKTEQHHSKFISSCDQCCLAVFLTVTLHNKELKLISVELLHTWATCKLFFFFKCTLIIKQMSSCLKPRHCQFLAIQKADQWESKNLIYKQKW